MHRRNPRRHYRALTLAILVTPIPAVAATADWLPTAPTPGLFSDPANWSTGSAPTAADAARFDTGSAHTVTLTADTATDQFLVANDTLALDMAGHAYTVPYGTSAAPSLSVGSPAGSALTIANSSPTAAAFRAGYASLAANAGDVASLTLSGPAVSWTAPAGYPIYVGERGSGSLAVLNGATLNSYATISRYPGSSGSAVVDGPGSTWTAPGAGLTVHTGGTLTVRNGGTLLTAFPSLDGTTLVDGAGSLLSSSGAVSLLGAATVSRGGSLVTTGDLGIVSTSRIATLALQDSNSSLSAGTIILGGYNTTYPSGRGTLNILGGSATASMIKLWDTTDSLLNLAGGSLKTGRIDSTNPARFRWTGGSLELTNSALQVSNPTTVSPALNYNFNPGPTVSLSAGMSLKLSGPRNATNYLVVDNGGTLSADNASVSVGDVAFVGYAGTGTLALTNRASMSSPGGTIGYYGWVNGTVQRGTGYVTLDDHASWALAGDLVVGGDGGGTLAVRGGSTVSNVNATIAAGPIGGSAAVDGPGSSWSSSGTLTVGKLGQGTLVISGSGAVSSATAIVASSLVQTGSAVTVRGAGSSWTNTTTLYVAGGQTSNTSRTPAVLSLSDQSSVTTRTLAVGTNSTSATGSITLTSAATLSVATSAYLGGITTPRGTATLSLTDSSATVGTTLKLHNTPNTALSLIRSTLTIGAPAAPGSLDNAAAIALADHSTLTLHGTLTNAGTLSLSPDSLLLWDPASATDPLATLRTQLATGRILPSSTTPTNYRPAYTFCGEPTAPTSLTVTLALTGDANLDGQLNADDYALLDRAHAKSLTSANWTDGDFNYDGTINNQDYLLIDTTFGQAHGFSPGFLSMRESQFGVDYVSTLLTTIPEPSSLACLFAALLPLTRRKRR